MSKSVLLALYTHLSISYKMQIAGQIKFFKTHEMAVTDICSLSLSVCVCC